MRLSAPTTAVWLIAVILGVTGILLRLDVINVPQLNAHDYWLTASGFVLLALACLLRRL